ncbi:hypothetical protein M6G53_12910 [Serratia nevei]|uniref:hypothetical protein n=1 Tax=Serratia nevei TaxID=2703794 RepID=UPI00209EBCCF|nr:hypothetical protein [Serratia nevei]MCP1106287.1 hypothetical protein [Serratia nevei]
MKKYIFLLIIFSFVALIFYFGFGSKNQFSNKSDIVRLTPIGTSRDDVLKFCSTREIKCTLHTNFGYYDSRNGGKIGVSSIDAILWERAFFIFTETASVSWGFDSSDKLLDIYFRREIDAF